MKEEPTYGKGGTYISHSKESLSLVYIQALLAKLGLNHTSPIIDNNSVDLTVLGKGFGGYYPKPKIDLQLKCTSAKGAIDEERQELVYRLERKNFNDLAEPSPYPSLLVVHHAPDNQEDWVKECNEGATIKNMSYWYSLKGEGAITTGSKVIRIPLKQKLDTESLFRIMTETSNHNQVKNLQEGGCNDK